MAEFEMQAGSLQDLWQSYAAESERHQKRIAKLRAQFNKIPNAQYSAQGYMLRSTLSIMYRQLEELRDTERKLRVYYRFSGQSVRESKKADSLSHKPALPPRVSAGEA